MNKTLFKTLAACLLFLLPAVTLSAKPDEAAKVRQLIDRVNRHWQAEHKPETNAFWDNAAYHTGNMEAYFLTGNEDFRVYSEAWAAHNRWMGGTQQRPLPVEAHLRGDRRPCALRRLAGVLPNVR